jgi:crotonobetainyl-CoA:carnitine CoA-transferase CaiB-like acyl-CoA transferase
MIQGMGAIMDLTGPAEAPPQKVGLALVDVFTGVYAVVAIQAALAVRERTGAGQLIDMSLLDTATSVISYHAMSYLVSGVAPSRIGNAHPNIVPYQEFATSDGHIIIAVGNDAQFRRLCATIDLPGLAEDPRFTSNELRVTNRRALVSDLAARIATFRRDDLLDKLEKESVPAGPINTVAQLFAEPQVVHRGMRVDLATGDGRTVPSVRSPILMSETPLTYERASPRLGEHTDAVLASLGYGPHDLARLRAERVIG